MVVHPAQQVSESRRDAGLSGTKVGDAAEHLLHLIAEQDVMSHRVGNPPITPRMA
jgi:hypothetical protein